jgi:hypothetical protein
MSTPESKQAWREYLEQATEFPPELRRCTCGTPSFNRDDHSSSCPHGPTPPLSSDRSWPPTYDLPETRF